jgi:PAS domain S-box-containing protein
MPVDLSHLADFVALAPDAMLVAGRDGTILTANTQADRLFGAEPGALVGLCVDELVPDSLRASHAGHRADFAETPSTRPMGAGSELAARRRDGTVFPTEISLSPVPNSDGLVLAAVRDLTDRKRAQARERQAFEINDGIVQSLVVAQYRLEQGEIADSREAIHEALASAKAIITDLLGRHGQVEIQPGDLRRSSGDARRRH